MRVGIDASRAFQKQRTGIEEYSYQVIKHLAEHLEDCQVVLYITKYEISEIRKADWIPKDWEIKIIKWPYLWTQAGLSLELFFHPVDVLFVPSHVIPLYHPKRTVVTVHGLEYEIMPQAYSFWERLYMRLSIKRSCRRSSRIIAVSKNTKRDLVELYKVPEGKVGVVYEGVGGNFKFPMTNDKSSPNDEVQKYKPYLLFIGRLEKRKNVEGIIEAYKILKERYDIPHALVLVGSPGYGYESIKYKVESSKYKAEIVTPGFVSEEEKYDLLKKADVFLFPTFYEGFGLPVLEAQNAGTPVVTSNVSSLPEVGGKAAAYCDPNEPFSIAEAVRSIIEDKNYRDSLIEKGRENVERFSWEKCAKKIAEILESV